MKNVFLILYFFFTELQLKPIHFILHIDIFSSVPTTNDRFVIYTFCSLGYTKFCRQVATKNCQRVISTDPLITVLDNLFVLSTVRTLSVNA